MFILSNLFSALAQVLNIILTIYYWLILIRALISWVNPDPFNPLVQFLQRMTEPVLQPIRKLLPFSPIDFSPIIAFVAIVFLKSFLVASLIDLSYHMRQSQELKGYNVFQSADRPAAPAEQGSLLGK